MACWTALCAFLLAFSLAYLGTASGFGVGSGWDGVMGFTTRPLTPHETIQVLSSSDLSEGSEQVACAGAKRPVVQLVRLREVGFRFTRP